MEYDKLVYAVCLDIAVEKMKNDPFYPDDPYYFLNNTIKSIESLRGIKKNLDICIDKVVNKLETIKLKFNQEEVKNEYEKIKEKCSLVLKSFADHIMIMS